MTVLPLTPDELLTTTRSVRKRLDLTRPVPMDLITECLQIALQAPSGGNSQGWHWLVITDQETRAAIGELYRRSTEQLPGGTAARGPAGRRPGPRRPQPKTMLRIRDSSAYLGAAHGRSSGPGHRLHRGERAWGRDNQAGLWGSVLPAAWSYMLAARARQLGTAWTTLHLVYEKEAADILGLPSNIRQGVLIPTAYYTGETFRPAPRRPVQEVMHINRW